MTKFIHKEILQSYCDSEDDSLVWDLFGYFQTRVPGRFDAAKEALKANDNKGFKLQLHSLKNSFLNVGALEVAEECQQLENVSAHISEEKSVTELNLLFDKFKLVEAELGQMLKDKVSFAP